MFRQSFCGWCFRDRGVDDATLLKSAKEIGYHGVEFFPPETWPLVKDAGLQIATHSGHPLAHDGLNSREHQPRILDEIKRNLDLAVQHAVPALVVFGGSRQPGLSDDAAAEITADGLREIAPLAEQANVTLVMELLNSKIDHAGYQCDLTGWAEKVCQQVASPKIKILFDIYHVQVQEGDLLRTMRKLAAYIGHYHTAGNPGRHEMNNAQEINYAAIRDEIIRSNYAGYVGHEYLPTTDLIAGLRDAYQLFAASK